MQKIYLLISLMSIILSGCTTTLTDLGSDSTIKTNTQTTVSTNNSLYPEDTLYAYLAQYNNIQSGENISECYTLWETSISEDDIKSGFYSGIKTDIHWSQRIRYSVSEIHNKQCRGGRGDPESSPTIGWFLVVGGDVYKENLAQGGYTLVYSSIVSNFNNN